MPTRPHIPFTTVKPCAKPRHRSNIPGTIECPRCIVSILPSQIPHRIRPLTLLMNLLLNISSNVPSASEVLRSRIWAKAVAEARYALLVVLSIISFPTIKSSSFFNIDNFSLFSTFISNKPFHLTFCGYAKPVRVLVSEANRSLLSAVADTPISLAIIFLYKVLKGGIFLLCYFNREIFQDF